MQKRQLMKFLQSCLALQPVLEPDVFVHRMRASPDAAPTPIASAEGSFLDFVARQRLSPALRPRPLCDPPAADEPCPAAVPAAADGVRAVCRHLRSLGVYGPAAYLTCVYGASRCHRAFAACAVWAASTCSMAPDIELEDGNHGVPCVRAIRGPEGGACDGHLVLNADSKLPQLPQLRSDESSRVAGSGPPRRLDYLRPRCRDGRGSVRKAVTVGAFAFWTGRC